MSTPSPTVRHENQPGLNLRPAGWWWSWRMQSSYLLFAVYAAECQQMKEDRTGRVLWTHESMRPLAHCRHVRAAFLPLLGHSAGKLAWYFVWNKYYCCNKLRGMMWRGGVCGQRGVWVDNAAPSPLQNPVERKLVSNDDCLSHRL